MPVLETHLHELMKLITDEAPLFPQQTIQHITALLDTQEDCIQLLQRIGNTQISEIPTIQELKEIFHGSNKDNQNYLAVWFLCTLAKWNRNIIEETTSLDLHNNQLTSLPDNIENLTNLTILEVGNNELTELPTSIGSLQNLTELSLYGNNITSLPDSFAHLTNLKTLHVDLWELKSIQKNILQMPYFTNLLHVNWSRSPLNQPPHVTAVPNWIGDLTNIRTLELYSNQLTSLPDSIGNLSNLTTLDVGANQLSSLPYSMQNLTNLRKLNLGENKLTQLPDWIGMLPNLTELSLHYNQLTSIPDSLQNLTHLKILDLYDNPLSLTARERITKLLPHCEIHLENPLQDLFKPQPKPPTSDP